LEEQLAATIASLGICSSTLSATQAELVSKSAELSATQVNLSDCTAGLEACQFHCGLPATGQTLCYDSEGRVIACASADFPGQDAFYQAI
jgi:hypothetical protein